MGQNNAVVTIIIVLTIEDIIILSKMKEEIMNAETVVMDITKENIL